MVVVILVGVGEGVAGGREEEDINKYGTNT